MHTHCVQKGSIQAPVLSAALVDVYLGDNGPSPSLQQDFLSTAAGLMSHRVRVTAAAPKPAEPAPAADEPSAATEQRGTISTAAAATGKQVMPKERSK